MADEEVSTARDADQQRSFSLSPAKRTGETPAIHGNNAGRLVIWTPSFLILFALTSALGLSLTTVLIQGWLNGHYSDKAVLLAYMPLLFCLWLVILVKAHAAWVRAGALFGCLWSLFAAGTFWFTLAGISPQAPIAMQISMATSAALLATFICLSLAYTTFGLWDTWFFRLLPLLALFLLGANYLKQGNAFDQLVGSSTVLPLYACWIVWWLRPSCWCRQPGPTFLFGLAPLLLLLFVVPGSAGGEQIFLFQQVFLLCILLGAMRILQGEFRHSHSH